ncbi:MAG: hypothetical protein HQL31_07605 [Planctomycetes bacterium]|nr:hypothetical protein [Planctomycetota bacterium]
MKRFHICLYSMALLAGSVCAQGGATPEATTQAASFESLSSQWVDYRKNLDTLLARTDLLPYEKQILERISEQHKEINQIFEDGKTLSESQKVDLVNNALPTRVNALRLSEEEFQRSQEIRELLIKVQKAGDNDQIQRLSSLVQLSNQLYQLKVGFTSAALQYRAIREDINRRADLLLEKENELQKIRDILKKVAPQELEAMDKKEREKKGK